MSKRPSRIDSALVLLILLCLGGIVMTYAWEFAHEPLAVERTR